ncbi:protein transport protein Sec31A isoform X3 [Hemibagrus wyckioides]|uniref:protein transport protein Sec31A isoform X3 n=1 Tax=Hemibagrus wyckioides TaxID=337641 RepID=UPI00266C2EE7|nr:protein transport protein Sec31A isoform X3 [Hemibagrus wyckioides]
MKLKEINRTAIQAWSPAQHHPIYLAAGTSAQQLDATFSTNASLEIFELDLAEPTLAMKSCGAFSSPHRYHKLVWGPHGINDQGMPSGVLIAGGETGNIILYDPSKIIAGDSEVVIAQSDKHTGPVRALDVNSFQTNLVASGGNESEIYIWDLNSFSTPMTPGPKSQPLEDISCVAWNCQVQHILASASPSGRASIWDLRKNDLIIKVSDHSNRMHCSGLAWNPDVATQLVLASEDDRMPVIQMWDLRFATSPLKVLENHTRGVLAIAWSLADPEFLLSCGKDNRILCWNPNNSEVLYELPTSQWCFDIQWCPRNPAVLSAASFDGRISIYSIMGGNNDAVSSAQADQISSSFANMDPFGTGQTLPPLQLPQTTSANSTVTPLKKPPKWIRRPVGASFAFGGKLVSLENIKPAAQQPQQPTAHVVHISQVVTDTDFLDRSNQLQATLTAGSFVGFCQKKIEAAQNEFEKSIWAFLKVHFEDDARGKYLELLGYKKEELAIKIASALEKKDPKSNEDNESSFASVLDPTIAPVCNPAPGLHMIPLTELDPAAFAPLRLSEILHGEPAYQPLIEDGVQVSKEPLLDLIPDASVKHVPDLKAKPDLSFPSASLVDFSLSSDLIPTSDPVSAFVPTYPVKPSPHMTQQFDQFISEAQPKLVPQNAPSGALHEPESDVVSLDEETLTHSVSALAPQESEVDLPVVDLQLSAPAVDTSCDSETKVVPTCIGDLCASATVLDTVIDQPQSILLLSPLVGSEEPVLVPSADQQSYSSCSLIGEAGFRLEFAAPASLQHVSGFLPQLDPQPVPMFPPPIMSQQPEIELTPTDESDVAPQTDTALPVNGQPVDELNLSAELLAEEEAKEEPALPEEVEENGDLTAEDASAAEESPELAEIPVVEEKPVQPISSNINAKRDVDGLITQALLIGDFEAAVNLCLHDNRMADAIILAIAGGPELLEKTQKKYLTKTQSKIGKIISAVVMRDWMNILETCDLQNWKEALAAVMTYAKPEEFSTLCGLLGSRLEAAEESALQVQACLCYICAGSVEQLVSCWSKAQDSSSPLSLQDLVEKVVILRQAVEKTQGGVAPAVGALLAEKMSQYASLLASQGSLQTAMSYLPTNTDQVAVQQLRERLSRALGQHGVAPVQNRHPVAPAAVPQQVYTPIQPQTQPLPPQPTPAAPTQQYYQVRAASTVTSWSNQTPTVLPSAPPPLASAKDLQAEPKPAPFPMQAPVSASPAVSSAFMYSQHYQNYPQVQQFTHGAGGPAIYQPLQYSSSTSTPLPPPPSSSAAAPFYPSQFMPPASSQAVPSTFPRPPFSASQQAPTAPPLSSTSTASFSPPPFSSGVSFQHGGPGSPTAFLPPPPTGASGGITQDVTWVLEGPQNGWNDPPALLRGTKKKKVPENYTPPAPITAPIMAPLGEPQPVATMQPSLQPQQLPPQPAGIPAPFNPIQQQPLAPTLRNPAIPSMPVEGAPGAPTGDVIQPMQSLPTEKITKKPIPDEHLILKTTFEGLIQKCLAAATDPQTKRKLDDANKRLESLYDKLREQTLSPAIVGGLHNMARSIESRAYTDGLNIHTHIVSNSNFSETSAFMPVLKVVLTQANKLGV